MKEVILKVHPLSRGVLLSEMGSTQPIALGPNDLIFPLLTSAPLQEFANVKRAIPFLTDTVTIQVHNDVAGAMFCRPYHVGAALFRLHKDQMCRYAHCSVMRGGDAWASIQEWLNCHQVDEDAYAMETAYKCWQRWNVNFKRKNPDFFSRIRPKSAAVLAKKRGRKMALPQCDIEQALERFLIHLERKMRRIPKRFPRHARAYMYKELGGLSERQAAEFLGMKRASVGYACRTMQVWIDTNVRVREAFDQTTGLLRCA